MIAIPNMEKPKSCQKCIEDCLNIPLDCYPDEYGENRKGEKIVCPLIDIVQCNECKWLGVDDGMPFCYWWLREIESDVFCSYGERRTDGDI